MGTDASGTSGPHGEYASDGTTLVEVIAGFEASGFGAQLTPVDGGALRCSECRETSPASAFALAGIRRTEGASDPADMVAVAALTCPVCGAKGTMTAKYGPGATIEEAGVMTDLEAMEQQEKSEDEVPLVEDAS